MIDLKIKPTSQYDLIEFIIRCYYKGKQKPKKGIKKYLPIFFSMASAPIKLKIKKEHINYKNRLELSNLPESKIGLANFSKIDPKKTQLLEKMLEDKTYIGVTLEAGIKSTCEIIGADICRKLFKKYTP
jgi:hypothetical protein